MKISELTEITSLIDADATGENSYLIINCPQSSDTVTKKISLKNLAAYLTAISTPAVEEEPQEQEP